MTEQHFHHDDPIDPKQWRSFTDQHRYTLIEQMYIPHFKLLPLFEELEGIVVRAREPETWIPYGLALLGDSGVGKTAAVHHWMKTACIQRHVPGPEEQRPYLYVSLPPEANMKSLLSRCLATFGDPSWRVGTTGNMALRLQSLIKFNRVPMICIDNFHHLLTRETGRVLYHCLDLLEQLIIRTEIAAVFIGHTGTTETLLLTSPRLQHFTDSVRFLRPFEWDRRRLSTIREFRMLLGAIDQALPLDTSGLDEEESAYRLFYATEGDPSRLFNLIRAAARKAVDGHVETLQRQLLADTFDELVVKTVQKENINPFSAPGFREARED